jgi:hypothetical protein
MGLAEAIQGAVGQPASVRIGTVDSALPLSISIQGAVLDDPGVLESYTPATGDAVVLLGQSSTTGSDPASWVALGAASPIPRQAPQFASSDVQTLGFTSTSYIASSPPVGVSFVAPPSGMVRVDWSARFQTNTINTRSGVSTQIATGSTLDAGVVVANGTASDGNALENNNDPAGGANTRLQAGMWRWVTGLTPGDTYNAVVKFRMLSAGNGDIYNQRILVTPM